MNTSNYLVGRAVSTQYIEGIILALIEHKAVPVLIIEELKTNILHMVPLSTTITMKYSLASMEKAFMDNLEKVKELTVKPPVVH